MQVEFNTYGNDKQKEVAQYWLDDIVTDIVYGGSKGSGKSYLGGSLTFGDAFIYPGTHYFIARKELNDLRKYTLPSIYEIFGHWGIDRRHFDYNGQDNVFYLHNSSRVYLLEAKHLPSDPQFMRFGSMQMTRGWIEEAGELEEAAKIGLAVSLGRWKNEQYGLAAKLLQTCNPSKNYLYYDYYQKSKNGTLEPHKKFIQAFPEDNKKQPAGYIDNLHKILKGAEKERLLFGNWEYDDDPAKLIEYEKILDCFSNSFDALRGEYSLTCDVARFGSDKTVIGIWDGYHVRLYSYSGLSINETAQRIKEFQNDYQIPNSRTIADEDGVGGGVVDILGCKGFVNNSHPLPNPAKALLNEKGKIMNENYVNLKSQCYFRLAERINAGGLYIECEDPKMKADIIQELEQVKQYKMDKDGKRAVLPKDKVKELIGRSPDFADTLMMREWFDLRPKFVVAVA